MSEYPLEGNSRTLQIPNNMIHNDQTITITTSNRQPQSLRSLANFTSSVQPDPVDKNTSLLNSNMVEKVVDESSWGPEMQNGSTTFVAVESDLREIFSPQSVTNGKANDEVLSDRQQNPLSRSYSRVEFEQEISSLQEKAKEVTSELEDMIRREVELKMKISQQKSTIEQLELDNIDLSEELGRIGKENKRLQEERDIQVQDIQNTVHDLKINLKEKEENVSISKNLLL